MKARMSIGLVRLKGTPVCGYLVGVSGESEELVFTTTGVAELIRQFQASQCKPPDMTGMSDDEMLAVSDGIREFVGHVKLLRKDVEHHRSNPGILTSNDNAIAMLYQKTRDTINWDELVERMDVRPDQQRGATPREPASTEEVRRR